MHTSKLEREELLQAAFRSMDADGNGKISVAELGAELRRMGIADDARELLATADEDGDGTISYQEFRNLIRGTGAGGSCAGGMLPLAAQPPAQHQAARLYNPFMTLDD
ncbi:hypothetical protein GPECTOR_6g828 [Gonium pectorale]|uniref:EF-hand domain-containing protein n=1 Tax=Gonium pectorale TaxID=33097 RepID=A0A150GX10_GONPE|nr:hypothetical protein GPECTOR_6g828 [Gonium pectorale]|eukprot:KXZ53910.1 hypothetical protein GPECTOR_6g828 [Gonium pectorale]